MQIAIHKSAAAPEPLLVNRSHCKESRKIMIDGLRTIGDIQKYLRSREMNVDAVYQAVTSMVAAIIL